MSIAPLLFFLFLFLVVASLRLPERIRYQSSGPHPMDAETQKQHDDIVKDYNKRSVEFDKQMRVAQQVMKKEFKTLRKLKENPVEH